MLTDAELFDILKSIDPKVVRLPSGWRDFARAAIVADTVKQTTALREVCDAYVTTEKDYASMRMHQIASAALDDE